MKRPILLLVLLLPVVCNADEITTATSQPAALQRLREVVGIVAEPEHIYEVSSDSPRYPTISAAIEAASNPNVPKVILVHPGKHRGPVLFDVPNTHLVGIGRIESEIHGSLMAWWDRFPSAIVDIQASNCTVSNITIRNTAKSPGQRAALRVGNHNTSQTIAGFRCFNATLIAAQDAVWMQDNVTGGIVEDCLIDGTTDVACNSGIDNTYRRCHVKGDGTWAAFWCGQQYRSGEPSKTNIINCTVEDAAFGILIARSHVYVYGCKAIPRMSWNGATLLIPFYATSPDNTAARLVHGNNQGFGPAYGKVTGKLEVVKATQPNH